MKKKVLCFVLSAVLAIGSCMTYPAAKTTQAAEAGITPITPTIVSSVENILPTATITYPAGTESNYNYVFKLSLKTASDVRFTGLSRYTFWNTNGNTQYKLVNSLADAKATVKEEWSTYVNADHTWEEKAGNSCDKIFTLNAGTYYLFVNTALSSDWQGKTYKGYKVTDFPLGFWLAVNTSTFIDGAKLKSCKNNAKKKVTVKYAKTANANGYVIQYSTNKKFKKAKKVTSTKTKAVLKSLKKKKTYYVRVRAYRLKDNVKYYGTWSNTKKVKVKK